MIDSVKRIVPPSVSLGIVVFAGTRPPLTLITILRSAVTGNRSTQSPAPDHVERNHAELIV